MVLLSILISLAQVEDQTIRDLVKDLGSDDIELRERSTWALGRLGEAALGPLLKEQHHHDPEVAARARMAAAEVCSRLPGTDLDLRKSDFHSLTLSVMRLTGKTLVWTDDLGLRTLKARIVSDVYLGRDLETLFAAYSSQLRAHSFTLIPKRELGAEFFQIAPPIRRRGPKEPQEYEAPLTRVLSLKQSNASDVASALAPFTPHCVHPLARDGTRILIVSGKPSRVESWEYLARTLDENAGTVLGGCPQCQGTGKSAFGIVNLGGSHALPCRQCTP